jgi:hypothetical protein
MPAGPVDPGDDSMQPMLQAVDFCLVERAGADEGGHVVALRAPFEFGRPLRGRLGFGAVLLVAGRALSEVADRVGWRRRAGP